MSRLIDADVLIAYMEEKADETKQLDNIIVAVVCGAVSEQPTAYDVEKVVEELEEERGISYVDFEEYAYRYELDLCDNDDWFYRGLERAIKIVKRGGVE